jgi:hypothetical protein
MLSIPRAMLESIVCEEKLKQDVTYIPSNSKFEKRNEKKNSFSPLNFGIAAISQQGTGN